MMDQNQPVISHTENSVPPPVQNISDSQGALNQQFPVICQNISVET